MKCDYCIDKYYEHIISLNISMFQIKGVNVHMLCIYVMCCLLKKGDKLVYEVSVE